MQRSGLSLGGTSEAVASWSRGVAARHPQLLLWLRRGLPPLVVFFLARVRLSRSAWYAGSDPSDSRSWAHWDSAHYFSIAERGYEFFSCARLPGYDPKLFCGNDAWLPGYPMLMRALLALPLRLDISMAGALISGFCILAALVLIWNVFLDAELRAPALLTLLLAGFFPGHVYHHAVFPVSLCVLFHGLALRAYMLRRFFWAGLAGACSAYSYSSGVFIAAVFGLHLLVVERHQPWSRQLRLWLLTSGITALGLIAFLVQLQIEVGAWNAYFLVQAKYAYDPTWPWVAIARHAADAQWTGSKFSHVQTFFVAVLALFLIVGALRPKRRAFDGALALFVVVYWWIPLALGGSLSLYRSESLLISAIPLARKLPVAILIVLVAIAVAIATKMDVLFFRNVLV